MNKKNTKNSSSLKVTTNIKAAGYFPNHNRRLSVKSGIKAGFEIFKPNHNRRLSVKSGIKAGFEIFKPNHNRRLAR